MNIFRLAADMLHLLSFIVMLYRMKTQRSCRGVSLKSQILFLIVFCCRYLVLCAKREAREAKGGGGHGAQIRADSSIPSVHPHRAARERDALASAAPRD